MNRAKKLRKMYRKQIDGLAMADLKKEIFRLARNRDVLGLVVIGQSIALIILLYIVIFH